MARLARVAAPGYPHHITQRGNRRQQTFFSDEDNQSYIDLMADFINFKVGPNERDALQKHERTGRPLGENGFISRLEAKTGRVLKKENRPKGPRKKQ